MTDKPYSWSFTSRPIDSAKILRNEPYSHLTSGEMADIIGHIILLWATHYSNVEKFSRVIFDLEKIICKKHLMYENFRACVEIIQSRSCRNLANLVSDIIQETERISIIRNAIIHGNVSWSAKFIEGEMHPTIKVSQKKKDTQVSLELTQADLEDLLNQLSNLVGRLNFIISYEHDWLLLHIEEHEIEFLEKNFKGISASGGAILYTQ